MALLPFTVDLKTPSFEEARLARIWCEQTWPHTKNATWRCNHTIGTYDFVGTTAVTGATTRFMFQREEDVIMFKLTWL